MFLECGWWMPGSCKANNVYFMLCNKCNCSILLSVISLSLFSFPLSFIFLPFSLSRSLFLSLSECVCNFNRASICMTEIFLTKRILESQGVSFYTQIFTVAIRWNKQQIDSCVLISVCPPPPVFGFFFMWSCLQLIVNNPDTHTLCSLQLSYL